MKTVKEWLETIEDKEVRERALRNMNIGTSEIMVGSLSLAVIKGFVWIGTPEGWEYWNIIQSKFFMDEKPVPYSELDGE